MSEKILKKSTPETVNLPGHTTNRTLEYLMPLSTSASSNVTVTLEIDAPPRRGNGLNDWMYMTAIKMAQSFVIKEDALRVIQSHSGNEQKDGEVERQVDRAYAFIAGDIIPSTSHRSIKIQRDDERIREMVRQFPAESKDIRGISPSNNLCAPPLEILRVLHDAKATDLLCLGKSPKSRSHTMTFREWGAFPLSRQLGLWEMCVPNLMRSLTGTRTDGVPGRARTRDNACPEDEMSFAVVEIDIRKDDPLCISMGKTPLEICCSFILSQIDPEKLRMVVKSGGKSLHAWIDVRGMDSTAIHSYFTSVAPYGVDPRGRYPEQQFRLPNGYRQEMHAKQEVLFFNPKLK
jgi:hypothetical protein